MVLQRERPIPLWGTAAPGAQVACRLEPAVAAASSQADGAGSWRITLPALPAGGPYTLTLTAGSQTVCLDDVWLGEVWLAGGQSNMELPLANSRDGQAVLARCADPRLHFYETPKVTTTEAAPAGPDRILACCGALRDPCAVRYAWYNYGPAGLYGGTGLPAAPFGPRTLND